MEEKVTFVPIAHIYTDFSEKFGIPRQSGRVPELVGRVVFEKAYRNPDSLRGIEEFSHLWLLFDFSCSHTESFQPTVRPPRLGGNKKVGVFASRSPFRPNPVGLSLVKLLRVAEEGEDGQVLYVSGVDILSGTPIFDIKPYLPSVESIPDARGSYASDAANYRLQVEAPEELLARLPEDKRSALLACLAEDPRPAYQADGRVYTFSFSAFEVSFFVSENTLQVTDIVLK